MEFWPRKYDNLGYKLPDNANDLSEIGKVPDNKKVGVFQTYFGGPKEKI